MASKGASETGGSVSMLREIHPVWDVKLATLSVTLSRNALSHHGR
jgi:hypothetical protein